MFERQGSVNIDSLVPIHETFIFAMHAAQARDFDERRELTPASIAEIEGAEIVEKRDLGLTGRSCVSVRSETGQAFSLSIKL